MIATVYITVIKCCAAKPNHELLYTAGTDFCLEDSVQHISFGPIIVCPLVEKPIPPPCFKWKITLNETDLTFDEIEVYMKDNGTYYENDTLVFSGNVFTELNYHSVLNISCDVSNSFGNDTRTTSISLCGKSRLYIYNYRR